ncbi:hypothetical protein EV421DRAFT_1898466 [Armillaria borealis]|uniref:Uncharacterized protein n=1 Tax=Armillaria borealis TaxID=47425 RepID=A0AA39JYX8_9AGAR|nr:hypothetical protein EV421DRAFT_1898466 [Armillaria borealis]
MSTRPLSLHVSALSDGEYAAYTSILDGIAPADDEDLNVREVRAWLRGRYPDAPVDSVLKLFSPKLALKDTLTRGQFYVAMRLLAHAQTEPRRELDRGLAFIQPQLPSPPLSASPLPPSTSPPPQTNPFTPGHRPNNPFAPSPSRRPSTTSLPPPRVPSTSPTRRPPLPLKSASTSLPPTPARPTARSTSPSKPSTSAPAPDLPPRKPSKPLLPPPKRLPAVPPKPSVIGPVIPPKLLQHSNGKVPVHTTVLMKQSLQASKQGSAMKKAEEMLERERIIGVLKSSSNPVPLHNSNNPFPVKKADSSSSDSGSRNGSANGNPLPSPPISVSSLEQVALATAKSGPPPRHPALSEDGSRPPPRHPALSDDGNIGRGPASVSIGTLGRSKTLHHHSSSTSSMGASTLGLGGRRRRPESVQVLMAQEAEEGVAFLSRHASLGPGIQKKLQGLLETHERREWGKRGVQEENEGLMSEESLPKGTWDESAESGAETPTVELDRDNLKWPVQEEDGWKRL